MEKIRFAGIVTCKKTPQGYLNGKHTRQLSQHSEK
jgi:hypothetical protein